MFYRLIYTIILILLFCSCDRRLKPSEFHVLKLKLIKGFENSPTMFKPIGDKELSLKLKTLQYNDQLYRDIKEPKYYLVNYKKQNVLDNENQEIVKKILDKYGYLSIKEIGYIGNHGLNLTLEHAPYEMKIKYTPIIDSAFASKKIRGNF